MTGGQAPDPVSAELRDLYEQQYSASPAEAERNGSWRALCAQGKADHVAELVRRLPSAPSTVVEIGCGDGSLLTALAERAVGEVRHGFEISERAVAFAASRAHVDRVERFDGVDLPVPDKAYDLGVLSHVIEHVPEPALLLREAARACRALVVEVPLEDNRSASRPAAVRGREEVGHLHRFSREAVGALARGAGLEVRAEVADPLPRGIHGFWADTTGARVRASAKAAARRGLFTVAPRVAERTFTLHYAALLTPKP